MAVLIETLYRLAVTFVLGAVPGIFAGGLLAALWSPFLISKRVQQFFWKFPAHTFLLNYFVIFAVVGMFHAGLVTSLLFVFGNSSTVLSIIIWPGIGVPLLATVLRHKILPEYTEAQPLEFDLEMWVIGILGVVWYGILTVTPLFILTLIYYMPS